MKEIRAFFRDYPAFAWGAVIVFAAIAYYFYRQVNQPSTTASNPNATTPTYILYDATSGNTGQTTGTTTGGTTGGNSCAYLVNNSNGAGIFSSPTSGKFSSKVPNGTCVNPTGSIVKGKTNKNHLGISSDQYAPFSFAGVSGFLSLADLQLQTGGTTNNNSTNAVTTLNGPQTPGF